MTKYRIEFDREACIGALACNAISSKFWLLAKDGKVDLKDATFNKETKKWELIIDEKDFKENDDAAYSCPVTVIKITKVHEEERKEEKKKEKDEEREKEEKKKEDNKKEEEKKEEKMREKEEKKEEERKEKGEKKEEEKKEKKEEEKRKKEEKKEEKNE